MPSASNGTLYRDIDLPLHQHDSGGHTHEVLVGETEIYDDAGKSRRVKPGDARVWFAKGQRHGIRCVVSGTIYFNSQPS